MQAVVQCIEKQRQKNITRLTPNCKRRRGHHSNSIVIHCMVLLLLALMFCLSGCITNKSWLVLKTSAVKISFWMVGMSEAESALWSHCFNLLFWYIKYIPEEENETTSEEKALNLWWHMSFFTPVFIIHEGNQH